MSVNAAAILQPETAPSSAIRPRLDHKHCPMTAIVFVGLLAISLLFTGYSLVNDVNETGVPMTPIVPFILLGVALLIALGFEFVNGFHDTANAVATVIYTHSLPPNFAVIWSGLFNFSRRPVLDRRGGVRHHFAVAGRIDLAGRFRRRLRDGAHAGVGINSPCSPARFMSGIQAYPRPMQTLLLIAAFRFFFYASENGEPRHIHI